MRAYRVVVAFITTALMLTLQAPLQAQCDLGWVPGPIITPPTPDGEGPDGNVYAIISWNLPTQPAQLIVGGDFTHIGGIAAHHIASWDGTLWHPLGGGIGGPVYALTTYGVNLIAGGQFSTPGACVASWDGTVWSSVANIYSPPEAAQPAHINALAVYNGELYMGGVFEVVDSQAATNCAIYNSVTGARPGPGLSDAVNALQTFDDDGSGPDPQFLYIGGVGGFSSIKKYDGVATTSIGTPNGAVLAMTVVDAIGPMPAGLIVAGHFGTISPPGGGNTILASNIARWDGTAWSTLGNGVSGTVGAVRAFGGNLIAGGSLGTLGGVSLNNLGKWDGSAWSSFNGGLPPAGNEVNELREFNGRLVIGGSFTATTSTGGSAGNLIEWTGSGFTSFPAYRQVTALAAFGSKIAIGGLFAAGDGIFDDNDTCNLIGWDGVFVRRMGRGVNGPVLAMVGYTTNGGPFTTNSLVVGGSFTSADNSLGVHNIAQWQESTNLSQNGWFALGSGFDGPVYALERFQNQTIAGGSFTTSGGATVMGLAKFTGTPASWQPLTPVDPGLNGPVYALKSFSTGGAAGQTPHLVIGGAFTAGTAIFNVPANHILQRDEPSLGGTWTSMGAGFDNPVYAIERYGNFVYAGGSFTHSGATVVNHLARFVGSPGSWQAVGNGIGFNGTVYALRSDGPYLYASGTFTSVDGVAAANVARWDGTQWSEVSGGANGPVFAVLPWQTELFAGGTFTALQASSVQSPGAGRYLRTGAPWIYAQPASLSLVCGTHQAPFSLFPAAGYSNLQYQWRKDGVPITDGPTGHGGSVYSGTDTTILVVFDPRTADQGSYDCVVSTACGSTTTSAATLTVTGCCPADTNLDNTVDVNDLLGVITHWGACTSPCPPACTGDIAPAGGDCLVNVNDLLLVISTWGPCP